MELFWACVFGVALFLAGFAIAMLIGSNRLNDLSRTLNGQNTVLRCEIQHLDVLLDEARAELAKYKRVHGAKGRFVRRWVPSEKADA